jgi:cbb3-type cytochrome oxidase subunit 3
MGLSSLGIFHTIIGVASIVGALAGFIRYGKINLKEISGKVYFYGTLITSITALGISKHGGFNPGHAFSVFIILLVSVAYFLFFKREDRGRARYFENFLLSFSFFLSLVPTVNETFTRVPVGHPLAKNISDPIIGKTLLVLFLLFIAGSVYQYFKQKKVNKTTSTYLEG